MTFLLIFGTGLSFMIMILAFCEFISEILRRIEPKRLIKSGWIYVGSGKWQYQERDPVYQHEAIKEMPIYNAMKGDKE